MLNVLKKLSNIGKKIFIVIAVYFVVINLFIHFINQDKPKITVDPVKKSRETTYRIINDPKLNASKEGKTAISIYRAASCGLMGEACTNNLEDGDKNYHQSLFGRMSQLITVPYRYHPASGLYWAYDGLQNAGFIPKTYAAEGIGFAGLRPLMNLWKVFRDVAYMILVLVLIAIGFMIMFRMKLNPQTVISVENALPRIIISMILITFSFAIAGFLIDLMYIIITLGIAVMSNRGNFFNITEMQNRYLNADFGEIWASLFPAAKNVNVPIIGGAIGGAGSLMRVSEAFMNLLPDVINQILRLILGFIGWAAVIWFIDKPLLSPILSDIGNVKFTIPLLDALPSTIALLLRIVLGGILFVAGFAIGYSLLPIVFFLLIGLTVVFLLFRIFFTLFAAYLKIILLIVFSPLFMLFEALPGRNAFGYWLKSLLAEILIFPLVIILFLVTYIIVSTPSSVGSLWTPPFLVSPTVPVLGNLGDVTPNAFTILLGFGIMFQIPAFIKILKEMLGVKDMPVGFNLGTFFGGATGTVATGVGLMSQIGTVSLGLGALGIDTKGIVQKGFSNIFKGGVKPPTGGAG